MSRRVHVASSWWRTLVGVAAVVLALALVACGDDSSDSSSGGDAEAGATSRSDEPATVAFSHPASQVPFVVSLQKQVVKAGEKQNLKVLVDNAQSKLDQQVAGVQAWVTQDVKAINLLPMDPGAFAPIQEQAQGKGICWQTYVVPMKGSDGLAGWSPTESGEFLGKEAVKWINANKADAKVLVLTASAFVPFADRTNVPIKMIEDETDAKVVAQQDALDQATGLTVTETVLKKHPDLDVVVAFNDDGALGAARAFADAGKDHAKTFIGGQDGSEEGLKALLDNPFYKASVAIPIVPMAEAIIKGMQACIDGNKSVNEQVPLVVATPDDKAKVQELLSAL